MMASVPKYWIAMIVDIDQVLSALKACLLMDIDHFLSEAGVRWVPEIDQVFIETTAMLH